MEMGQVAQAQRKVLNNNVEESADEGRNGLDDRKRKQCTRSDTDSPPPPSKLFKGEESNGERTSPCKVQIARLNFTESQDAQVTRPYIFNRPILTDYDEDIIGSTSSTNDGAHGATSLLTSPCKVRVARIDLESSSDFEISSQATTSQGSEPNKDLLTLMEDSENSSLRSEEGSDSGLGSDGVGTTGSHTLRDEDVERKRRERRVRFHAVTVYYFPRAQGFCCVPSQGGSTLGMSTRHVSTRRLSVARHCAERRRRLAMAAARQLPGGHNSRNDHFKEDEVMNELEDCDDDDSCEEDSCEDDSDSDEDDSEYDCESVGEKEVVADQINTNERLAPPTLEADFNREEEVLTEDDEEQDLSCGGTTVVLVPVSARKRRALLRAAGVKRIDPKERDECRAVRASREVCGCDCRGFCDPETCACSRAGVKCQVDRVGFPCGCHKDGCANTAGRAEFNPHRVRTHFMHTLMRLALEERHLGLTRSSAINAHQQYHRQHRSHEQNNLKLMQEPYRNPVINHSGYPDLFHSYGESYGYEGYMYQPYEEPAPSSSSGLIVYPNSTCHNEQEYFQNTLPNELRPDNDQTQTENATTAPETNVVREENFAEIIKNSMVDTVSA